MADVLLKNARDRGTPGAAGKMPARRALQKRRANCSVYWAVCFAMFPRQRTNSLLSAASSTE
eukprot:2380336-Pyramimonas_sp.AAC.1